MSVTEIFCSEMFFLQLRAFAQPGNTDQMDFALKMGNETLTQMEKTFGIKYPMPKLGT